LTSGNSALASATIKQNHGAGQPSTETKPSDTEQIDQGFVILETNYKLYAYTGKEKTP
jgi:transcription initiation factor TFIIH subunit 4